MRTDETKKNVVPVNVEGYSMAPFILPGSRLRTRDVSSADLKIGDVVSYIDGHGVGVVHRIVAIKMESSSIVFGVRGDACTEVEWVPREALIELVTDVEHTIFSYHMDGVLADVMRRVALAHSPAAKMMKRVLVRSWRTVARCRGFIVAEKLTANFKK